jgi:hypothetical protein
VNVKYVISASANALETIVESACGRRSVAGI